MLTPIPPRSSPVTASREPAPAPAPTAAPPVDRFEPLAGPAVAQSPRADRAKFCRALADAIEAHRGELRAILTQVDNHRGAEYELTQVLKTLRGVTAHELHYLDQIDGVKNVAVYGSRNIPLYTLVMHALLPAMVAEHVHFRTPEFTGPTYRALHDKLKEILPEYDFSGLELLPNVNYDAFRKEVVLGLNRKGNRAERPPCDAVIFVGSPETAEDILEKNEAKVKSLAGKLPPFRQIFLKFGSGLNPVVVTQHAGADLRGPVAAAIDSIRINNGQDCIAPKLYAVHGSVLPKLKTELLSAVRGLEFGPLADPKADYTPLTFTQKLDDLVAFREKHAAHLANPEAILDPTTRRVDPHVFVFPYSKFLSGEVELKDHYAPFLVLFSYGSDAELRAIANDPRLRDRAMFASIFGNAASTEMWQLRKWFEDNFHSTVLNLSIFDEESGNFPFGGYGGKASSVEILDVDASGELRRASVARPLLFSKEAAEFFPSGQRAVPPAQVRPAPVGKKSQAGLVKLLADAADPEFARTVKTLDYDQLRKPGTASGPRGVAAIRAEIQKGGLKTLVHSYGDRRGLEASLRDPVKRKRIEKFYGAEVVDWEKLPPGTIHHVEGVLLHPTAIGRAVPALNTVRGDLNPHLGFGVLAAVLSDRTQEFLALDAIWPGCIPKSEALGDLVADGAISAELEARRAAVARAVDALAKSGRAPSEATYKSLRGDLLKLVTDTLDAVQARYPAGAFVKNYGESTTGDLGIQITSFHYNAENIVDQYLTQLRRVAPRFAEIAKTARGKSIPAMATKAFQDGITAEYYATGAKFLNKLLSEPEAILVQERVKLAKTDLGFVKEIRVDFVDGEPVSARGRYTHEYVREEEEEAMAVLAELFRRAPEQFRYLPGGADVAQLEDGTWKIIELNAGPHSGSISAVTFPIETNRFISKLQGKDTELIAELEAAIAGGPSAMRAYLKSLKVEEEKWKKWSIDELSIAEVAKYFRDRLLDGFREDPTPARADAVLADLRAAFDGVGGPLNRDLPLLVRGAENYLTKKLTQKPSTPEAAA